MIAIVYISRATVDFDRETLKQLMVESRVRNRDNQITGMLIYKEGEFIQVLEGEEKNVEETLSRIRADKRHECVEAIFKETIEKRFFPLWAMGLCNPKKCKEVSRRKLSDLDFNKVTVYKLLRDFKNGLI